MKSDREFLDGVYKKAEKMDAAKTISQEEVSLPMKKEKRKVSFFPRRAVQFAGSLAVLTLVLSVSGILPQKEMTMDPGKVPRVASGNIDLTEDHPLFEQSTEILEVKAEKKKGSVPLILTESYRESGEDALVESFLAKNELGIQDGQKAILFLEVKDGQVQVLDVFLWEEETDTFVNVFRETITRALLKKVK